MPSPSVLLEQKELTEEQEAMEKLETEHKHGVKLHIKRIEQIMFQDIRASAEVYSEAMMFIKHEVRVLMVGLEADEVPSIGRRVREADEKTTIPYKLKLREYVTTIPTVGFNVETVEYENIDVTVRDVVGQDQIRLLWRHYYQNVQGFIFVIYINDRDRIEDAFVKKVKKMIQDLIYRVMEEANAEAGWTKSPP